MITREDVESHLLRLEEDFEELEQGMWAVDMAGEDVRLVIHHSPPLLLFRIKVMEVPEDEQQCTELFRRLLELNATDLVHGAYGIEEGDVILSSALQLENLDFNEFQATVDSMQMAVASHFEALSPFRSNC
ncbi:MAG TPA: YbjN domain-containing protein [Longimicrobiaceae bacterium]|nr:YbjN domain-containing protein [Longimicrobiaceae bacterium]